MEPVYYPVNDFGPLMKGMVIGGMGIVHVFLAQFAIGAGMLMCSFQRLTMRRDAPEARRFLDGYFKVLVLVSFVLGAITGVGMWFTTIQVSARTIGVLLDEFHWLWAVEWTFFCLEVVAGYSFYRYGKNLPDGARMKLLVLYSAAAWFSLFWINGILAFQLTPGDWSETRDLWDGFFNPSFYPSLIFRTIVAMALAGLSACVVINLMPDFNREERTKLIHHASLFLLPMLAMPLLAAWYFFVIPEDSRSWALGVSPAMTMFAAIAAGASVLVGAYAVIGLVLRRLYVNGATATLLLALAFGATAGGEFVREGVRKPYTVRNLLYSNSILASEVAHLREHGSVTGDPYPLRDGEKYSNAQLELGAKVFRQQCSVCHTISGANGLVHLAGTWSIEQKRLNIAKLQDTKPFMPPFAGTPSEVEAIAELIAWVHAGRPDVWAEVHDPEVLAAIENWMNEAGTR